MMMALVATCICGCGAHTREAVRETCTHGGSRCRLSSDLHAWNSLQPANRHYRLQADQDTHPIESLQHVWVQPEWFAIDVAQKVVTI